MTRSCVSDLRVRYAETDQMGVVYHVNYLVWCEVGRTDYLRRTGTSYAELESRGIGLAVTEATLRCIASARYDDEIKVTTTLGDVKSRTLTFDYSITHAKSGALLATARTVLISVDGTGRVTALPEALRARLLEGVA